MYGSSFRVQGFWSRVQDSTCGVQSLGFRFYRSRIRVQGLESSIRDSEFRVQGSGFRVQG